MPNMKKDSLRLQGTSAFSQIALAENQAVPKDVQILKVGKFAHPSYGDFEITTQILNEMKSNFDKRVRGIDVAFDYFHDSGKEASGWVNSLELREDGTELWANVEWTPKALQKLSERELRYFSPDFAFQWTDAETNVKHNNVLFGGGLTNRPFLKEMQAIVADETPIDPAAPVDPAEDPKTRQILKLKKKKLAKQIAKLAMENPKTKKQSAMNAQTYLSEQTNKGEDMTIEQLAEQVAGLEESQKALVAENTQLKADNAKLLSEKEASDKAVKLAEKEKSFNVMLSEGKACPAQKEAYIAGDMDGFVKLAQPLNTKGSGSVENGGNEDDKNTKILKLAEEKKKANPATSYADCVSQAKKEIEKQ